MFSFFKKKASPRVGGRIFPKFLLLAIFLCSLLVFIIVELYPSNFYIILNTPSYLVFHNIVEFFSIIASFSIFLVGVSTYRQSQDDGMFFLGWTFFGVGLLDFMHTLSFPGEPAFITSSSTNKGILFWLAARLLFAAAFLVSAFVPQIKKRFKYWKQALVAGVFIYSVTSFFAIIFYESTLPAMFIPGIGLTPLKIYLEYTVIVLLILAYAAYIRIYFKTLEKIFLWYLTAITVSIFSEFAFTLYNSAYDIFNMLGHVYKFIAFFSIYIGVFIVAIKRPYIKLSDKALELENDILLRKKAEMYSDKLISTANAIIVCLDIEGKVTVFNDTAEKVTGYKRDEVIGKNWFELIVPQDHYPEAAKIFKEFKKKGKSITGEFENPILAKDGKEHIIDWRNSDLLDNGKVIGTISYGIDVTERKRVEEALKESKEELQLEVDRMPMGHILWSKDFRAVTWNPAAEKIFGFTASEAIGKHPYDFLVPKSAQPQVDAVWRQLIAGDATAHNINENITKDGRIIICDWTNTPLRKLDGTFVGVLAVAQDITERKMAEAEREQFLKFFKISNDIMVIADPLGSFKKVNPACFSILGYSESDLLSKPFIDFVHPDDKKSTSDEMARQMKLGSSLNFENRYVCKDGTIRWLSWRASYDKVDGITYATARDITDRKLAEAELINKNRTLRMLSNINQALIHINEEELLLKEACRIVSESGGYRMLWIGFKENNKEKTIRPVAFSGFESGFLKSIKLTWADSDEYIPAGTAIRTGRTYILQDISLAQSGTLWQKNVNERGYRSVISLPLRGKQETFGAFTIFSDKINAFSADEVKVLEELTNDLAFGIVSLRTGSERELLEEELLKASSDRYKALFISSRDAIMTLEPPDWKFTSSNPITIKMFKAKDEGDFLRHGPWDVSPKFQPDGRRSEDKAKEMIEKAMNEGYNFFEWTHKRLDGEEFPAEVLLSKVKQNDKTFLHALVRDITERKKMEKMLKEYAEEKFKVVFDNAIDGVALADIATKKFSMANNSFMKMLGYSLSEIMNLTITDIHPEKDIPYVLKQFERQMKGEISLANDIPVKRKDGSIFYADINSSSVIIGEKEFLLGVFRDITDRKKVEETLKESEEKLRKIFDNSAVGISIVTPLGKWTKVNKALCRITGYSEEELLGNAYSSITFIDDIQKSKDFIGRFISGEIDSGSIEKRYNHKDGRIIWIYLSCSLIRDQNHKPLYFIAITEDITERKELDEAKDSFLSVASHQLRTPLSMTKWTLESFGKPESLSPQQKEKLDNLVYSNERLIRLIDDLLNVSLIDTNKILLNKKSVDIKEMVKDLSKSLKFLTDKHKKVINLVAPPDLENIYCDPILIHEAIENLIINAINYSPESSSEINVRIDDSEHDYLVSVHNEGAIDPQSVEKIKKFSKFVRGNNAMGTLPQGSGLGLYVANKVIELNGGSLWFESNINTGTTFYLTINK